MADRAAAWNLLTEFTQSESLRKHALAVESCMRAYARKFRADEELWGVVGLIHDFDYEKYPTPEEHPFKGNEILDFPGLTSATAVMNPASSSQANRAFSIGVSRETPL